MTFLTPILLFGTLAGLIPLLLHLLNKRKERLIRWGPMHLLHEVLRQKQRRFRLEQWLLLVTRIIIPILLALALARPVLALLQKLPGFNQSSLVVLWDNSFSMRAPTASGTTEEQARTALEQITQALPQGSDVQLINSAAQKILAASTDMSTVKKATAVTPALAGPWQVQEALQSALAHATKAPQSMREILVVSDFQKSDWEPWLKDEALPALDLLKQQKIPVQLTFYHIPREPVENLSLTALELSSAIAAQGQTVGAKLRIQNHSARTWQDVPVHLEVNGARSQSTRINLPASGETTLTLTHAFPETGDHALTARIEGDALTEDNSATAILQVRDQLRVLLVTEEEPNPTLDGALDYLELALTPNTSAEEKQLKDLIQTQRIDMRRLRREDLKQAEVVIAANLDRPERLRQLEEWIETGGGLLYFPGSGSELEHWQKDNVPFMPAKLHSLQSMQGSRPTHIQSNQRYTHPAFSYFSDTRAGRLADAEIRQWWALEPQDDSAQAFVHLDGGNPLFMERSYGHGRVIISATSASPEWNSLPLQPFFVPMMQRLVAHLATATGRAHSFKVGKPLVLQLMQPAETKKSKKDRQQEASPTVVYSMLDPQQQKLELQKKPTEQALQLSTGPTSTTGVYELKSNEADSRPMKFAVNVDPNESNLQSLSSQEVQQLAARHGIHYANSISGYQQLDRQRRHGSEVWPLLLLATLILLFAEVLLTQRMAGG